MIAMMFTQADMQNWARLGEMLMTAGSFVWTIVQNVITCLITCQITITATLMLRAYPLVTIDSQ